MSVLRSRDTVRVPALTLAAILLHSGLIVAASKAGECRAGDDQCTAPDDLAPDSVLHLTATEAVQLLCDRKITAEYYAGRVLASIERGACLNAWASVNAMRVLADARAVDKAHERGEDVRPLCGLAFAVKDNIDVAGYQTGADTPALQGLKVRDNSPIVTRLQQAHGVVVGKTRMHELAFGGTTINVASGPTLNPYSNHQHVGGSSGGTGAAIAARMVAAGFCSDTEGSCRIPASLTGTAGYRPTTHCYNAGGGIVPMTTGRDTVGVMARTIEDIMLFDSIFNDCPASERAKQGVKLKGLRMGYPREWWQGNGKEAQPAFNAALAALKKQGIKLVELNVGDIITTYRQEASAWTSIEYEMPRELARYLYQHNHTITINQLVDQISQPWIKEHLLRALHAPVDVYPSLEDYINMIQKGIPHLVQMWTSYFDDNSFDIMVTPATPIPTRPIDQSEPTVVLDDGTGEKHFYSEGYDDVYCRTNTVDPIVGVPGLSIPIGLTTDGLPIGLQFQTRPGDDALLLQLGRKVEGLFAPTPPPPMVPACTGCKASVKLKTVTWEGGATGPLPNDTISMYDFILNGECALKQQLAAGRADDAASKNAKHEEL
ncbi:hypothetical protein WJX73_005501 [Symbiochloris irregularis]|uniref:Amidase domain-containing protein n=1 Tax=Symbiochloris irregularis TaxID=706552 RepID=A0AAW1NPZ7_9CHLO